MSSIAIYHTSHFQLSNHKQFVAKVSNEHYCWKDNATLWTSTAYVYNKCWQVSTSVNKCQQVSTSVSKCRQVSASVDKCQHMLTHVNKCQQVSTSVNTCQHMSTSVNKCQQVSTSVDKCQQVSTSVLLKVYACLTYSQASGLVMSTVKNFSKFMSVLEYRTLRHSLTAARHSWLAATKHMQTIKSLTTNCLPITNSGIFCCKIQCV